MVPWRRADEGPADVARHDDRMSLETGPVDLLATLAHLQDQFAAAVAEVDPDTRVPWCGRWRVRSLVVHLARVHHWAAAQARCLRETPLGRGPFDLPDLYGRCAAELRDTLAQLDPQAAAWTLDESGVVGRCAWAVWSHCPPRWR